MENRRRIKIATFIFISVICKFMKLRARDWNSEKEFESRKLEEIYENIDVDWQKSLVRYDFSEYEKQNN